MSCPVEVHAIESRPLGVREVQTIEYRLYRTIEPKQRGAGASVSSDARRVCDASGQEEGPRSKVYTRWKGICGQNGKVVRLGVTCGRDVTKSLAPLGKVSPKATDEVPIKPLQAVLSHPSHRKSKPFLPLGRGRGTRQRGKI